ncbi:3'-5' exoribonuclease YhaM [Salimicrobium halophilum]|uniref:3'-5' exoribonuclease n=1 Tax=Salimicrobium halophilum TaxID=86666 RepID=A0A1G8TN63_9BACI|nr:3'-5' exoribonuclease YhaM [Salimicrobium halophilum]SDJ42982.1 3'-5' exoribonuclease [Salimicrobium halophilum]
MSEGIAHYQVGETFDDFLLITSATKSIASNGKPFLALLLRDGTGEIDARLWAAKKEDETLFKKGVIVKVNGEIGQFRNKPQLKIHHIRQAQEGDNVEVKQFVEKAPVSVEWLEEQIKEFMFEMMNANLQRLTRYFVKEYHEELFAYPAATRNHHNYVSGLAHHIVTMLRLAREIAGIYPEVDKDLLYAGIIAHDLGKIRELSDPDSPTYTTEGRLLGHISMMVEEVEKAAKELQIEGEEVMALKHLVLSHHGKNEWGSPKTPHIREAEILHYIDMLDSRIQMMNNALQKTKPGTFTERIYPLEQRSFYKPAFHSE